MYHHAILAPYLVRQHSISAALSHMLYRRMATGVCIPACFPTARGPLPSLTPWLCSLAEIAKFLPARPEWRSPCTHECWLLREPACGTSAIGVRAVCGGRDQSREATYQHKFLDEVADGSILDFDVQRAWWGERCLVRSLSTIMDEVGCVWNDILIFDTSVAYTEAFGLLTNWLLDVKCRNSSPFNSIADVDPSVVLHKRVTDIRKDLDIPLITLGFALITFYSPSSASSTAGRRLPGVHLHACQYVTLSLLDISHHLIIMLSVIEQFIAKWIDSY